MKCPYCGTNNIAGADSCESCDEDFSQLDGLARKQEPVKGLVKHPLSYLGPKEAVRVNQNTPVYEAVKKMNEIRAGCVLVENRHGDLVGIVTERDILMRTSCNGADLEKTRVSEIMTRDVETLNDHSTLAFGFHLMSVKRVRHVPVIRPHQEPGVISARDLLKYIAKNLVNKK